MEEIRPWLFIGKYRDTLDKTLLERNKIKAMLQLAEDVKQPGIISLYLPVEDLAAVPVELIERGIQFVKEQYQLNHRILVACGAGINRSAAFCIIALKEMEKLNLLDAYKEVKKSHFESLPHEPVWASLCSYYDEPVPYLDIMRLAAK